MARSASNRYRKLKQLCESGLRLWRPSLFGSNLRLIQIKHVCHAYLQLQELEIKFLKSCINLDTTLMPGLLTAQGTTILTILGTVYPKQMPTMKSSNIGHKHIRHARYWNTN